jgi:LysR family transcriptional activator of dmlA
MDIDDLKVFCLAARRASFAAVAKELGTTPAHVSKRIAILETTLAVRLFHRTTRRVAITADGEIAYQWARRILEDVTSMTETLQSTKSELSGLLRISTSLRLGRLHVAPILSRLGEQYPKLDVWLELLDRHTDLINENIDIDIRFGDPTQPQLIAIASPATGACYAPRPAT